MFVPMGKLLFLVSSLNVVLYTNDML